MVENKDLVGDDGTGQVARRAGFISVEACIRNIVLLAGILCVIVFVALDHFVNGSPISQSKLALLTPGLGQEEVISVLGSPSNMVQMPSGDIWLYGSPFTLMYVKVYYDTSHQLLRYEIDE